jgi:thymidine kinase
MDKIYSNAEDGYLELWTGPMYSGKTSKILELYKQFNFCGIKTCVINYEEDNRYPNSATHLSSHDQIQIPCLKMRTLTEFADIIGITCDDLKESKQGKYFEEFLNSKVILINEGQFFIDIVEWVQTAVDVYKKKVYICGLDGDFERKSFTGNWLDLIRFCDKVYKLHSFCNKCKQKPAIFSHRIVYDSAQKIIGANNYIPLCRGCFTEETKNIANLVKNHL